MMKWWLSLLMLPFLLCAEISWQADLQKPFQLIVKISSQQVSLGDVVHLEMEVRYPSSYQLDTHSLLEQLQESTNPLAPQQSLLQSEISSSTKGNVEIQQLSVKILPLVIGQIDVPYLSVTFLSKESTLSPLNVFIPTFSINVLQPSSHSLALASPIPLEPQFPLGLTESNRQLLIDNPQQLDKSTEEMQQYLTAHSFPWLFLIILTPLAALGWMGYLMRDRFPKRSAKSPVIPPKKRMMQALQSLQKRSFNQDRIYDIELSSILLDALQARFGWKTREMTTFEIAQAINQQSELPSKQGEQILFLLREMDQIKFANKQLSQKEKERMFQQVQELIDQLF